MSDWLLNEFPKHRDKTLRGETLKAYYNAEMLLHGWERIKPRGCSCNYNQLKAEVDALYEQWLFKWQNEDTDPEKNT